ncbi:erythromycin esterase family protein [Pseudoalteromonas luteoviolacea]|uniref:erythromycin esterase family protein n=1 Tax=Pseudoalteromonas luteoviolacea TaxID=43657 RepID=UPI001B36F817|nr:erythromycin esterase family protein [Pseudoalteromonas luteoviolacea]MBQ4813128.1 erythromycin esterase family protein [Pseudoalteromonas luteoviolacea]
MQYDQTKHALKFATVITFCFTAALVGCGSGGSDSSTPSTPAPEQPSTGNNANYVSFIRDNHLPIANLTDTEDFQDLKALDMYFHGPRIVQLGESSHGSKQMNQIKGRLAQYLHQYHDFNTIAFESSAFACSNAQSIKPNISGRELMGACIFGIWMTESVLDLFDYIVESHNTGRPLKLAGFDIQRSGSFDSTQHYQTFLSDALIRQPIQFDLELEALLSTVVTLSERDRNCFRDYSQTGCDYIGQQLPDTKATLDKLVDHFANQATPEPMTLLVTRSMRRMLDMIAASYEGGISAGIRTRDRGMADNFIDLADSVLSDEKIIIWAHNFHIAEHYPSDTTPQKHMGAHLADHYGEDLYTVALYMLSGEHASNSRQRMGVTPHTSNSLESLADEATDSIAFLPLNKQDQAGTADDWLFTETSAKEWGTREQNVVLANVYDAIILLPTSSMPDYL